MDFKKVILPAFFILIPLLPLFMGAVMGAGQNLSSDNKKEEYSYEVHLKSEEKILLCDFVSNHVAALCEDGFDYPASNIIKFKKIKK